MADYANPAALVSTQWVADHLNDPNVRLIEVDVDTNAYGQGHIQGAVGVNWTTQLGDPVRRVCLLGEQDLRPPERGADERRPQEVGAREPSADDRRALGASDDVSGTP